MLDSDTKRRIDTARDILVGKVPDPKSQVEQITIALIYKFMDDMDAESEELGGKRKFFTKEFARYGWAKLMAPSLGGHEMLGLYGEGISKMPENPGIPPLFRDIFKNAYLPYRDPETLKSFLKIINEFSYDHSEKLGDAYEYLLSILGSQGAAGQFRTPRHIIDFMVEVIAPRKGETILDPACGTAGFLISAYKHILRTNTDAKGHSKLTPDDKGSLARNFKGYDIDPLMARLAKANLYLHGFTDPHIYEYDTLTSEERWNDFADVILANPPFMSPKGGIKPHKRFSIQAKRSEVLFVDYMAEHLTPTGRAAIIVPEGIIFQSQTAYKELRKMLVENSLVAVVSLPAGCFNPYSGVKTSILILNKALAKKSDSIAFFKVENDGFGLGAQRRAVEKNDLPEVLGAIKNYELQITKGVKEFVSPSSQCLIVPKIKIAANGDYNLSGERYREGAVSNTAYPLVPVSRFMKEGVKTVDPRTAPDELFELWSIPAFDAGSPELQCGAEIGSQKKVVSPGDVLLSRIIPHIRRGWVVRENSDGRRQIASTEWIVFSSAEVVPGFLRELLVSDFFHVSFMQTITGVGGSLSRANPGAVGEIKIPLPPLEVQKEIVADIEGYQKVINGARAVLDNYRPHIPIDPDWPMVELGEVCDNLQYGSSLKSSDSGEVVCIRMGNIQNGEIDWSDLKFAPQDEDIDKYLLSPNDVLFNRTNSPIHVGKTGIYRGDRPAVFAGYLIRINYQKDKLLGPYLNYCLNTREAKDFCLKVKTDGINQSNINAKILETFQIPLPPLATQKAIVAEIEAEQALVAANRELVSRFEKKIQTTLARVWGEGDKVEG
jgi:type I restriction enzyme M protein